MTVPSYANWFDEYGVLVEAALEEAFEQAAVGVHPGMPPAEAHRQATKFASDHAGELLKPDGKLSMAKVTQNRVKKLVANTVEQGQSLGHLKKRLASDVGFSKNRAVLTARTETAISHGQGSKAAAKLSGRGMKRWITQGVTCDICRDNEADGDIEADESFSRGHDTIPGHPNCECNVRYFHGAAKKPPRKPPVPSQAAELPVIPGAPSLQGMKDQSGFIRTNWYFQTRQIRPVSERLIRNPKTYNPRSPDDQVAGTLINAVGESKPLGPVYRGVKFPAERPVGWQKGQTVDFPLSSFSSDKAVAQTYSSGPAGATGEGVVVELHRARGVAMNDLPGRGNLDAFLHEVITAGRARVTKIVQKAKTEYIEAHTYMVMEVI